MATPFTAIYNCFLSKITDDMYVELTPADTVKDLQSLLIDSLAGFEFPRFNLFDYEIKTEQTNESLVQPGDFILAVVWGDIPEDSGQVPDVIVEKSYFGSDLTQEEINIIAVLMMISWVQRQVTSIENTRMKYSGADFKMTSQASHLGKLLSLLAEVQRQSLHIQRLYKRRKLNDTGGFESNWSVLRGHGTFDDKI